MVYGGKSVAKAQSLLTKPCPGSSALSARALDANAATLCRLVCSRSSISPLVHAKMSAVDVQMAPPLPLNGGGHPNGHGDFNGVPREPKFASGLILPPPEIKCACLALVLRRIHANSILQRLLTEQPLLLRGLQTLLNSRIKSARTSVRTRSSRSSTPPTLTMLTIGIVWRR